ncbi:MAG: glycosyltransferase family 4 protein [Anaerolineae bacterium]|nr:glycosyltransferase family 4 protein [Anaerolineae bacterium]
MKIILFANTDWYLYNFRLPLGETLRSRGHEVIFLSPPGAHGQRLEAQGFRWVAFPLSRRGTNPLTELATIWALFRFYKKQKPDIVHHFTIKCVIYGSLAARLAGVKTIVNSITGLGYVFIQNTAQARLLRLAARQLYRLALRGTHIIFQNPDDMALFQKYGLVQSSLSTALIQGSGVDIERFVPTVEAQGTPLIILPGRMLYAKGVAEFVEAARILHGEGIKARFALVGNCDLESSPDAVPLQQLQAWQREGHVEWLGWQEDMTSIYASAHVICLPSYREGLPRALIEAAACGRAVVASDVPGCREVVQDGESGLLVPAQDAQALAGAIRRLLDDTELRLRMGRRGREIAEQRFSTQQVVSQTISVYNNAVSLRVV